MDIRKILSILNDLKEIDNLLSIQKPFDRAKAEATIVKHTQTNKKVAILNTPLSPNYVLFSEASDESVKSNLLEIKKILEIDLINEKNKRT